MAITMFQASVPVFIRMLSNLSAILEKAAAHCEAKKIEPAALIHFRLYPDMFDFCKQIQIAGDAAKIGAARLAGVDAPVYEDSEKSFADLIARIQKTIAYLQTFKPEQIDGSEAKEIILTRGEKSTTYTGLTFLLNRTLPNFYFHITTAYDMLRHNGLEIGKRDYLGKVPA